MITVLITIDRMVALMPVFIISVLSKKKNTMQLSVTLNEVYWNVKSRQLVFGRGIAYLSLLSGSLFVSIYALVCMLDIHEFFSDKNTAIHLYGMSSSALHWQFRNFNHYLFWNSFKILLCIGYILLCIRFFKNSDKRLFTLLTLVNIVLLILYIRYHLLYAQSGYDHYPGFDPYII